MERNCHATEQGGGSGVKDATWPPAPGRLQSRLALPTGGQLASAVQAAESGAVEDKQGRKCSTWLTCHAA